MTKPFYNIVILLLIFCSCTNKKIETKEFEENIYIPSYSSNFLISGSKDSRDVLISAFNPWQGSKDVSSVLLIKKDSLETSDFEGKTLKDKAQRIICMSSTHIAMLDALGAIDKVVGVSGMQYISNPYIREKQDRIKDIGYEGNIDYETLVSLRPDLVLLFSVNGASSMESKLNELGIPYIYIGDYVEEDPLGKVEWIVPLAEIIGDRDEGIRKFQDIAYKYENLKEKIKRENLDKPKVMVNAPFLDSWFMPSTQSYIARMIEDAGGDYVYKKNTGTTSEAIDLEEALSLVSRADYWINIGSINTLQELKSEFPKFKNATCIINGNVYNNNLKKSEGGGNDCYESGVVNPDLILRDMIKIFHPELVTEIFTYYHKLQ